MQHLHVDEFFETGKLRLSSFSSFKKHHDDERRDGQEGANFLYHQNADANFGVGTFMFHGEDAFVLCTCMQFDRERMTRWGGSYIRIDSMTNFASAISSEVRGFKGGLEGPCLYLENRMVTGDSGKLTHADMMTTSGDSTQVDLSKVIATSEALPGPQVFFTKLKKHAADQEYRFVWFSSRNCPTEEFIECPAARQFCSRPVS